MGIDRILGDDDELAQVEGIGALPDDLALRSPLSPVFEKGSDILERLSLRDHLPQGLGGGKRLPVPRKGIGEMSLGNGHQGVDVDPVLEPEEEMHPTTEDIGLIPRPPVQGDDLVLQGPVQGPQLLHDANLVVRYEANTHGPEKAGGNCQGIRCPLEYFDHSYHLSVMMNS